MTPDATFSPARKALLAVVIPVALFVAVVAQMTVVNRLPLPGSDVPDLVLLLVTAIAVATTPVTGAVVGFAGGLALDIAPPATHDAGEYALVFCLVCYAAARVTTAIADATGERTPATALTVMATAAACGEAGKAALGLLLSDPNVTGPSISRVLPGAVLADLLLSPFVLWSVLAVARRADPERAPRPEFTSAQRFASVFRLASAGAAPDLRLAGTGTFRPQPAARREPRLRLAGARSPALAGTSAASSAAAQPRLAGGRAARLSFAGSGASFRTGGSALGPSLFPGPARPAARAGGGGRGSPPRGWLRVSRPQTATVRRSSPPRGWLRVSRPQTATVRRSSPPRGWLGGAKSAALTGAAGSAGSAGSAGPASRARMARTGHGARSPRLARWAGAAPSSATARLSAAAGAHGSRGRSGPGRGWLRAGATAPAPARRTSPGKGWLRTSRPSRRTRRPGAPSSRWLRRSRARARWRDRRRNSPIARFMNLLPLGGRR